MADKKIEILRKLENGEITAEDALGMLNQQPPEKQSEHYRARGENTGWDDDTAPHNEDISGNIIDGVFSWVGDLVNDISDGIRDMDIGGNVADFMEGVYGHYKGKETFSVGINQGIKGLTLVGKNARVEVRSHYGSEMRIECSYDSRRPNPDVHLHEDNGYYKIVYEEKSMRHFKILCEVPKQQITEVLLATKNDKVSAEGIVAGKLMISTKNGGVRLEESSAGEVIIQSRNDNVKVRDVNAGNVHVETTNGSISTSYFTGDVAYLKTSNASIKTKACYFDNMRLATTNAGLKIAIDDGEQWDGERSIEATTSNGGISFQAAPDVGLKLDVTTSSGKISCERDNLTFSEFSKNKLIGESIGYGSMSKKIAVKLGTTNSGVKIREN